MGRKKINLVGKKFNRLLVIEDTGMMRYTHAIYKCLCDCGNTKNVASEHLKSGNVKSCGCLAIENGRKQFINNKYAKGNTWGRKSPGENGANTLFRVYKSAAKKRGHSFQLKKQEFLTLTQQNCFYCNKLPSSSITANKNTGGTLEGIKHSEFIYNGIDRIDNKVGYIIDNCVPCCKNCNRAKASLSYDEFLYMVKLIYKNLSLEDKT